MINSKEMGSALRTIEHQKKMQKKMFNETLKGRKTIYASENSIAADRGLIMVMSKSNSMGYNSKMKLVNEKMSIQVMNKYKNARAEVKPSILRREIVNKDTIKMAKVINEKQNNFLVPKAKSILEKSEKLLNSGRNKNEDKPTHSLKYVDTEVASESFRYRDIDKYIRSYKKTKNQNLYDNTDILQSLTESFKNFKFKRNQDKMNIRKSLPKLRLDNSNSLESKSVGCMFTFHPDGKQALSCENSFTLNLNFKDSSKQLSEISELPPINLKTERRMTHKSSPLALDLHSKNFSVNIKNKNQNLCLNNDKLDEVLAKPKFLDKLLKKSKNKLVSVETHKKTKKLVVRRKAQSLVNSLERCQDETPGVYKQFKRGIEGRPSLFNNLQLDEFNSHL